MHNVCLQSISKRKYIFSIPKQKPHQKLELPNKKGVIDLWKICMKYEKIVFLW